VISSEGIFVDPNKVRDVLDWEPSKSVHQVRSFFGLVGYLSKVHSELLQDFKTYHRTIEEGYQICLEQRM
jgi:hypothetical protein